MNEEELTYLLEIFNSLSTQEVSSIGILTDEEEKIIAYIKEFLRPIEQSPLLAKQIPLNFAYALAVEDLGKITSKLLHGNRARARVELEGAYKYSRIINGENHLETLGIKINYIHATFNYETTSFRNCMEGIIKQLQEKCAPNDIKFKKILAIADYSLAQHYYLFKDTDKANTHLNRSERLRKEYHASDIELDKINFLRAAIACVVKNEPAARPLLEKCYAFRKEIDEESVSLIPVVHLLSKFTHPKEDKVRYLKHLISLQKKHRVDPRQIINSYFELLETIEHDCNEEKYEKILNSIEGELNKIPVTQENNVIAENYIRLARAHLRLRESLLRSSEEKRSFFRAILGIITKAENHFRACPLPLLEGGQYLMEQLKEYCINNISFCDFIDQTTQEQTEEMDQIPSQRIKEDETEAYRELLKLSEYTSEAKYSQMTLDSRPLTLQEFELLPQEGSINPFRLRTAQGGMSATFGRKREGDKEERLETMRDRLIQDPEYRNSIPPVEIGIHKRRVYSFDTRRHIVHMQAKEQNDEVLIRYVKISGEHLEARVRAIFDSRPWNGFVTAIRYRGIRSQSAPYINPKMRDQLTPKVTKFFKEYPSARKPELHDDNGFPIARSKALKIHKFLMQKQESGIQFAIDALKQLMKIREKHGDEKCYLFLLSLKDRINVKEDKIEIRSTRSFSR